MSAAEGVFAGGGQMGALMRTFDWASTPVGPVEQWPQSLKTSVSTCLNSRFAILIWWGPDLVKFYNDRYAEILGNKHPHALGAPGREVWPEIWHIIAPMLQGVMERGEATWSDDLLLELVRNGYPEELYFTFSYSPIRDESGRIVGVFTPVQETTERVIGERRLRTLRDLAANARAANAGTIQQVACVAVETLSRNPYDLPFSGLYLMDSDETAVLCEPSGSQIASSILPSRVSIASDGGWLFAEPARGTEATVVPIPAGVDVPSGAWPIPPPEAMVIPIAVSGQKVGFLIAGISPRKRLDDAYRDFLMLVAGNVTTALAEARAFDEERKRAEALAQIDRAKTQFFSNVSHEFRTPLTLLLGPLEDALASDGTSQKIQEDLETAHRNGLRLLRLVNSLLDFSRIEAGRIRAKFTATDLGAFTSDLAASFRSAIERAGMKLVVECDAAGPIAWIDREMWEKVVLNLLSNAYKFTFEGQITVRLHAAGGHALLEVQDTGTGIPPNELPRLFERFHRVEGAHGRTIEGSGIGLALVQELVRLHGGTVEVESAPGRGSTFRVSIPLGTEHVPKEQTAEPADTAAAPGLSDMFVAEALRWLPSGSETPLDVPTSAAASPDRKSERERVLVVDDNADMRAYIQRLLSPAYEVVVAANGNEALSQIQSERPDLVVSDVFMPELDGFGLLTRVRSEPSTRTLPVILLSARAGEEARSEGMDAGADDYLVKPFAARELLARVRAHLSLARSRRESEAQASGILESITDGFVSFDRNWRVVYLNSSAERLLRPPQQLIGKVWWQQFPATVGTELETQLRQAAQNGSPVQFEYFDKSTRQWFTCRGYPGIDGSVSLYFRDITDEKRIRHELDVERERLAAVFEQSPSFMAVLRGPDHVFERANAAYYQVVGHRELIGKSLSDAIPEVRGQGFEELLDRVMRDGRPYVGTGVPIALQREPNAEPEQRFVDFVYAPLADADGGRSGVIAIGYDVTERVTTERELRRRQAELASVFDAAPVGIALVDRDMRYLQINDELAQMNRQTASAHVGRTIREVLGNAAGDLIEPMFRQVIDTGEAIRNFEAVVPAEIAGIERTYLAHYVPVRSSSGQVLAVTSVVVDISERKSVEQALQRSERELRQLADSLPQLVWVTDGGGKLEWFNRRWYEYTGATLEESIRDWTAFVHPDDAGEALRCWETSVKAGEPYQVEYRCRTHDGAWRWMLARAEPLRDESGRIKRWFGTCTDIEDQKQAQQQLRGQQEWLEAVLNLCPVPVVLVEPGTGRILFLNNAARVFSNGALLKAYFSDGQHGFRLYDSAGVPLTGDSAPRMRLARGEELRGLEVDWETNEGRRTVLVEGTIVPAMHGHEAVGLSVFQDVTQLKAIERALRRSNEDLQQFAYVASHDLQEPLRTITSFSQLLERSPLLSQDEKLRFYLDFVIGASKRMSVLIKDLLTYSRVTSDRDQLPGIVDLNEVVAGAVSGLRAAIEESGAILTCDPLPRVNGDARQLEQAFQNLLSNALKYRREGLAPQVQVGSKAVDGYWQLSIRDNGQGFAPEYADHVFGIFKRLHGQQVPGTGIGLAIVKTVIERHGGRVWAESAVGEGATFYFTLPMIPRDEVSG